MDLDRISKHLTLHLSRTVRVGVYLSPNQNAADDDCDVHYAPRSKGAVVYVMDSD